MLGLITGVLFAALVGYFATQNTSHVSVQFAGYMLHDIPLYVVMVGSVLLGLLVGGLINLINGVGTFFSLRGRESRISQLEAQLARLKKENTDLHVQKEAIKGENRTIRDDKLEIEHPVLHNIKHTIS